MDEPTNKIRLIDKFDKNLLFRKWQVIAALALLLIIVIWWLNRSSSSQYVTTPIIKGDVSSAISTTGTVNPVATVQVGTFVSGTIQKLYCDFNTKVKAGQLCAKIDPRPYQVIYDQAAANLTSAKAQRQKDQAGLIYAAKNYRRDQVLQKRGIISKDALDIDKSALDQAKAQIAVDQATIKQREAALDEAKVNLNYTNIVSPVNGTVVARAIDVGQTVAASFQTPTLFLIAKDLTKMQVDTNVSESDIGGAKLGQKAEFTVEAYPDEIFQGRVTQVRQAPITVQNVVTYNVVISTNNPKFKLLPGMTANTRIIIAERKNVLLVPVQALRFSLANESRRKRKNLLEDSNIYTLTRNKPIAIPVIKGLSDGTNTEVSGEIKEGDEVIINEIKPNGAEPTRPSLRL